MVMRIEIDFEQPLSEDQRLDAQLAVAALAKSKKMRFVRAGRGITVHGESMSSKRVLEALKEMSLEPSHVVSTLDDEEDAEADDLEVTSSVEKVKPIGR